MITHDYLTNQLIFFSNAKFILDFIKSKDKTDSSPRQFSLNAIKKMPESLLLPLDPHIRELAISNMEIPSLPPLGEAVNQTAINSVMLGKQEKQPESVIFDRIESTRKVLIDAEAASGPVKAFGTNRTVLEVFEQAVSNYHEHKFFCQYDWRFTRWGTVEDIHSITQSTFELPTAYIEFQTKWTPPIPVMEALASFFPSVRFELQFRYLPSDAWKKVEIFPNPPFGY